VVSVLANILANDPGDLPGYFSTLLSRNILAVLPGNIDANFSGHVFASLPEDIFANLTWNINTFFSRDILARLPLDNLTTVLPWDVIALHRWDIETLPLRNIHTDLTWFLALNDLRYVEALLSWDVLANVGVDSMALPVHHVDTILPRYVITLHGWHVLTLLRVVNLLTHTLSYRTAFLFGNSGALSSRDIFALFLWFLVTDLLVDLLALSSQLGVLHGMVLSVAFPTVLIVAHLFGDLVTHPVVDYNTLPLLHGCADIFRLNRALLVVHNLALPVGNHGANPVMLGLALVVVHGVALLVIHSLALVIVDSFLKCLLYRITFHLGNSETLLLLLHLTISPCDQIKLIVTFRNVVCATFLLVLGCNHGLLLGLTHVVHHVCTNVIGGVCTLLPSDIVVHSLVLGLALLAVHSLTLSLGLVIHMRLLYLLALLLRFSCTLVLIGHIRSRRPLDKTSEEY
jgi:hypothetical protein